MRDLDCRTRYFNSHYVPPDDPIHLLWLDDYTESIADSPHLFDLVSFENVWALHGQSRIQSSAKCSCVGSSQLRPLLGGSDSFC